MTNYIRLPKPQVQSVYYETFDRGGAPGKGGLQPKSVPDGRWLDPRYSDVVYPAISIEKLESKDVVAARSDPNTEVLAHPMPVTLIEPLKASIGVDDEKENWGLAAVGADRSSFDGEGAVVAILDTGIDQAHEAFKGIELVIEDFTAKGGGGHDGNGHGTHCAGTVFGRNVAGRRIGVAPGVRKALIGKVIDDRGNGSTDALLKALEWAADYNNGEVDVIAMSLGINTPGYIKGMLDTGWPDAAAFYRGLKDHTDNLRIFDAIMQRVARRRAGGGHHGQDEGVIIIAASGNQNQPFKNPEHRVGVSLPAAAESVLSVGAAERTGVPEQYKVAPFSNCYPLFCAPGVDIASARVGGGLTAMSGTSMACPHVAGVAALWWQKLRKESANGKTSAGQVEAHLRASVRPKVFAASVPPEDRGFGMVTAP